MASTSTYNNKQFICPYFNSFDLDMDIFEVHDNTTRDDYKSVRKHVYKSIMNYSSKGAFLQL